MASNSAWGIDLGNRALKAIKLIREGDRFRIDDFEVIEHEQILSVAGDNRESLQKRALAQFVERHLTKGSIAGVSVSGQSSFARFIKLPPVETKKVPEIVRFEAIQQIPFPLDDVEWAYQLFQEKDSPDIEVGIFAMRKDLVNHHIGLFTDLGLNVQTVQMHPLAVYNGMRYDGHVAQTTMFMDAGAENTDLIIADGETVWLRTLPIGGNNFTETLAKSFKLSFPKAEELKRNAATSKYAKQIFQAMRPVFADLVAEIQRSIGFYASVHRDARIQRIVALGSTFQLPGLQKYLQQNLQLPVEKLDAFKSAAPADAKLAANLPESVGTLAGAYGLAIQAMNEAKIVSSLLPENIRRRKMWQEKTKWFATAAATFLVGTIGIGASYFYNSSAYEQNAGLRSQSKTILAQAQARSGDWKKDVESVGEPERKKAQDYRQLQEYRGLWIELVSDILSSVPHKSINELKPVPRKQRDLISFETIQARYWADLKRPLALENDFSQFLPRDSAGVTLFPGAAPGADIGALAPDNSDQVMGMEKGPTVKGKNAPPPDTEKRRGYVITIKGNTPRSGDDARDFIEKSLVNSLRKVTAEAAYSKDGKQLKPYYIGRVELLKFGARYRRAAAGAAGQGGIIMDAADALDPDMLGGGDDLGQLNLNRPQPLDKDGRPIPPNPAADRYFAGESIEDDTSFTVLAAIVLDPPPPQKKAE